MTSYRTLERELVERTGERDAARELFLIVEEQNEAALRLHRDEPGLYFQRCATCHSPFPCPTRRALTGADEAVSV